MFGSRREDSRRIMQALVKSILRAAAAGAYHASGLIRRRLRGKLIILMYHRVLTGDELDRNFVQPGMYVRSDVFEKQMAFLKRHFEMLSFAGFLSLRKEGGWDKNKRYCIITFDDGWRDNYVNAYPVLRKLNIPATIFLPTAFIGTNQWFWSDKLGHLLRHYFLHGAPAEASGSLAEIFERCPIVPRSGGKSLEDGIDAVIDFFKKKKSKEIEFFIGQLRDALGLTIPEDRRFLDWDEIEEMSNHNVSFGSHTCSHSVLTNIDAAQAKRELRESLRQLREKKINQIPVLCYPNGNYSQQLIELAKEAGYRAAATTQSGCEGNGAGNVFTLKRIGIHNDVTSTIPLLGFHLSRMARAK